MKAPGGTGLRLSRARAGAKRGAVHAFLIFHIVSLVCWSLPFDDPLAAAFRSAVRPYFVWAGLFQSWDAFSPAPKSVNSYVEAIVLYDDGHSQVWTFPRMERISLTERYFRERYRKFVEYLKEDSNAALWPDAARRIARLNSNPRNQARMVFLVRYWSAITKRGDGAYVPGLWDSHVFCAYTVKVEDLE